MGSWEEQSSREILGYIKNLTLTNFIVLGKLTLQLSEDLIFAQATCLLHKGKIHLGTSFFRENICIWQVHTIMSVQDHTKTKQP